MLVRKNAIIRRERQGHFLRRGLRFAALFSASLLFRRTAMTGKIFACFVVLVLLLAGASYAQQCTFHRDCGPGRLCGDGTCRPAEEAAVQGGRVFWVAQQHPQADDGNPGTAALPWKTISRATGAGVLAPGDAVLVRAGLYRESVRPREGGAGAIRRITYAAYPGDEVVVTGADVMNEGWTRDGAAWRLPWTTPMAYGTDLRRELVVVDGVVMRPVYARADLRPGTFFVEGPDDQPRAIFLRLPNDAAPSGHQIEVGTRHPLFSPVGPTAYVECGDPSRPGWLRVIGFTFRHAVNRAQWGALCPGGEGSLIEENTVAWTNGMGIEGSGKDHIFRGNRALDNGQAGFGGICDGCLFEYNESSRNNWKGHSPYWEAGGGKWVKTRNTVFRHHLAVDNDGPGLWLDYQNDNNVIENSRFYNNEGAGIFLEFDTKHTLVRNNVVVGTRQRGWTGAGLLSQAASHNVIVHNTFIANEGHGLWLREDPEDRAPDGHNVVYNNLFVGNAAGEAEAYEIQVEDETLEMARTNRLDGNLYWFHPNKDANGTYFDQRTFFFRPDASSPSDFRGNDLARWRYLTGGDAEAALLDAASLPIRETDAPDGWRLLDTSPARGHGVALPPEVEAVLHDIEGDARPTTGADVGADQHAASQHTMGAAVQRISLETGWNLISSYVAPEEAAMEAVFADVLDRLVIVKDGAGGVFMPEQGINTIGAWRPEAAYEVYMRRAAALDITGTALDPLTVPLALTPGWNLVPYLYREALPPEAVFGGLGEDLVLAKQHEGAVYYPASGVFTLSELKPGQGYKVYVNRPTTLQYPTQ